MRVLLVHPSPLMYSEIYNAERQTRDHLREVVYAMQPPPAEAGPKSATAALYVHAPAATRRRTAVAGS